MKKAVSLLMCLCVILSTFIFVGITARAANYSSVYVETFLSNGHTVVIDPGVAPTCTQSGLTEGSHCSVCGIIITVQKTIKKLNHEFVDYKSNNDATCSKNATEIGYCKFCGITDTRQIENTIINHEYSSDWSIDKPSTCSETGIMSKHCIGYDDCGSRTDVITVPAKGHTESDWEIVLEATDTAQGIRRKTCVDCCETLTTEYYNKHIHSYKWAVSKSATYFGKGTSSYKCSGCGEVLETKSIAKLTLKTPTFKLTGAKGKFTVKYTKVTGATGFEVKYKLKNGKFKTVKVTTKKSMSKVIKNLKKGKYTVQIRAVVKDGKKTAYSSWAKAKTTTVK